MKRPTFLEGVVFALVASFAGSVLLTALATLAPSGWLLRLLIAGIAFAYVVYLLTRSRERVGRITAIAAWFAVAAAAWFLQPPLLVYVLLHVALIWLIRSLYFHGSALSALADFGLNGLSIAAAVWTLAHTGSVFIGIWCFFLLQACFVAIPPHVSGKSSRMHPQDDRFEHAHRAAEAAVRNLSTIR